MEECTKNVEVGKRWSEQDMVYSFGGGEIPGTPDGMFEDTAGRLTCVQVVRVPVLADMSSSVLADRMLETVLTKVLKSQAWMKATRIVPDNFVVFCWLLPLGRPRDIAVALHHSRSLIKRVRSGGWPFSLHVTVPDEPEMLFPSQFARNWRHGVRMKMPNMADIIAFRPSDFEDDDEPLQWDIFTIEFDEEGEVLSEDVSKGNADEHAHEQQGADDSAEDCDVSPLVFKLQQHIVPFRRCRFVSLRQRFKQAQPRKPSPQKPGGDDDADDYDEYDVFHAGFILQQHFVAFCALLVLSYLHRLRQEKPLKPVPHHKPSWVLAPLATLSPFMALWSSMIPLTSSS